MAGKEPEDYQPRRAFARPDGDGRPDDQDRAGGGRSGPASGSGDVGRDSGRKTGARPRPGSGHVDPDRTTTILPRVREDGSTTVLPRTRERQATLPVEDEERPALGRRTRLALVIAGVVAVVVLGLLLGYLALGGHKPSASPSGGTSPGQTSGSSASPNNSAVAVLADASMINERSAKRIDPTRTWLITSTQHGLDANSPQPACFTGTTAEGQPNATQTIQRLLNASGKNAPALLHQADAYATPEDAAQAYAVASRTLGTCAVAGSFLESGRAVTGLGDSATAAIVAVQAGGKASYHSVALNRTGRVVNIVDVAQQVTAADINQTANALGDATGVQCTSSGGACAGRVAVKPGPPPLGGDQPGFLAVGDLPPVGVSPSVWGGDPPHAPDPDFVGTGCETTNWAKVAATNRTARTYLPQDSNATFGLDEIILTTASPRSAGDLVNQVKKDLDSCAQRKLTATVSKPAAITGPGAENSGVGGWSATVAQKTASTTTKFRVGIVSTGNKVIYTFLNPVNGLDFTDTQWQSVVLRSGQRASQVP